MIYCLAVIKGMCQSQEMCQTGQRNLEDIWSIYAWVWSVDEIAACLPESASIFAYTAHDSLPI